MQVPRLPVCTVQAKNSMIFGRFLQLPLHSPSKELNWYEISKYALTDKAHPPNKSNSGTLNLNMSLNERSIAQGQKLFRSICLAFSSLEEIMSAYYCV
jgi:hypothetical protein